MPSKYTPKEIRGMILGLKTPVELANGTLAPAINLDNAATTPAFKPVAEEIREKLLHYGSIGRGTGQKSAYSSKIYEDGREIVKAFVGANDEKYDVFYVNCTTDGMNKLASALIESPKDMVLATRMEHHANDLPWRERAQTVYIDVDEEGRLKLDDYVKALEMYEGRIKYVTVAAASNVTGYVNEVHKIAGIAHRYGAKIIVDGAQIVAHRKFSMKGDPNLNEDIDFFVFSAHKMYSPYGGGAVVGLSDVLNERLPVFYGGGMVDAVTDYTVVYSPMPGRFEAGSPNYPGVVGMLKAMEILNDVGFEYIEEHEQLLLGRALKGLSKIKEVILYGSNKTDDRVGLLVFNIKGMKNDIVAQQLAGCRGIAVRHAKFCAHTYVDRLLQKYAETERQTGCVNNGMVRVSFGIYNTKKDVDALIETIKKLLQPTPATAVRRDEASFATTRRMPNDRG